VTTIVLSVAITIFCINSTKGSHKRNMIGNANRNISYITGRIREKGT